MAKTSTRKITERKAKQKALKSAEQK